MEHTTKSHVTQFPKYIFVTGGVLSGLGKGITAASIGAALKSRNIRVSIQKCDPYLNVDAGMLNPREHGECFVGADGVEADLDLGHYERFLDIEMRQENATLMGRIMLDLLAEERSGKLQGHTVQMVPHVTTALSAAIEKAGKDSQVHIVEIGGTVGDYEGLAHLEAIRELAQKVGRDNCAFVHVVYVPFLQTSKEFKTKPAQNAVRDLRSFGISPDVLVVRTEQPTTESIRAKLSMFCGVDQKGIVLLPNADTVYRVPLELEKSGIGTLLANRFGWGESVADLASWESLAAKATARHDKKVRIGIVAKYLDNEDTYFSVIEALRSAAWHAEVGLEYSWIDAESLAPATVQQLSDYDGLLLPGGFGGRGVEGMVLAADYALQTGMPYFGICLGLQVGVIAAARRGGVAGATSGELDAEAKDQVIYIMDGQEGKQSTGGTLRLGDYPAKLESGSRVAEVYGTTDVTERHRHRYEVNQKYKAAILAGGLRVVGTSPDGRLVEFVEATEHPYFVATQAHPEFRSRPMVPHPLFTGLIRAALSHSGATAPSAAHKVSRV